MSDLLATGSVWLDSTLKTSVSQTVRYRRGADYVDLSATIGATGDLSESTTRQAQRTWQFTDFMVLAADLVIATHEIEPEVGDRIEFAVRGTAQTYEVLPDDVSGKCFGYSDDSTRNSIRIHTKQIG